MSASHDPEHRAAVCRAAVRWLALAALVCAFAGCATGGEFQTSSQFFADQPSNGNGTTPNGQPPKSNEADPPPRTLPEAVCAYLKCLHTCPCNRDGTEGSKEQEGKKNPDEKNGTNGKQDKNGEKEKAAKSNGNGNGKAQEGKKNPDDKGGDEAKDKEGNGKEKDDDQGKAEEKDKVQWLSAHAQATFVTQAHSNFRAPYTGPNSLQPNEPSATSVTSTLFLAARLWDGGDLVFNPEIAGGRGFSGTTGLGGFSNGEITRVGTVEPTPYFARLYLRQTWGLSGEMEKVEDAPNEIAGKRDVERISFQIGKMTATDAADDNRYAHDPRTQFLNWALMYNGAWDYPANVRGYTYGMRFEYDSKDWTLTYGVFAEPAFANGAPLDPHFLKANGHVWEAERHYKLNDHPGNLRLLAYLNNAHMGNYRQAVAEMPANPDITQTRAYRVKYGFGLSWDQELTKNLGVFGRLGWDDGHTEAFAFTEIDRTASLGLSLKGACWCRPKDVLGVAGVVNGLAGPHRDYLAAGGIGFLIGDGRLNYAPEEILELYYNLEIVKGINVTLDFQQVNHPAYNRDRGPVSIGALRFHLEY